MIIRWYCFHRYGAGYDLAARRKNATRESTATLKAWLNEHKKNPYPTKGEKIMLAIITKMTLTQVSTWFANARRRLKKENKMTWEPKNKTVRSAQFGFYIKTCTVMRWKLSTKHAFDIRYSLNITDIQRNTCSVVYDYI